jgi:hypothetical protein
VRGLSDDVPAGYTRQGMEVYRYLVRLGVEQQVLAHHPELKAQLGEASWRSLISAFIQGSAWRSHFYGDLIDEFHHYLTQQAQA